MIVIIIEIFSVLLHKFSIYIKHDLHEAVIEA